MDEELLIVQNIARNGSLWSNYSFWERGNFSLKQFNISAEAFYYASDSTQGLEINTGWQAAESSDFSAGPVNLRPYKSPVVLCFLIWIVTPHGIFSTNIY